MFAPHATPATVISNLQNVKLTIDIIDHPSLFPLDLRQFFDMAEQRNIEFGLPWFRNLVDTVYKDHQGVRFYVLRRNCQPVAVLPLRMEPTLPGKRLHSLSNFYTTLYEPLLDAEVSASDLASLFKALRRDFPGYRSLMLSPMDTSSPSHQILLAALRQDGMVSFDFFVHGNWYLPVTGNWADYLASRTGGLRSTIKRMEKKFAAAGGTIALLRAAADLPTAISAYEAVYKASWKKQEPFPDFMPGLLETYAASGELRLGLAWLGDKPIAAQLWIVANGRAHIYKVAYDEAYKSYSPGTLVTAMLMQHAIDVDQVHEVDYLIGDDPYKATWMSARRERRGIVAYNPRSLPGLAGLVYEYVGRLIKAARQRWG